MRALAIVFFCVAAAVVYGIAHDQVTARVCVEYFTIGHPRLFDTENPTLLALGWGVVATWWVGLLLGIPLAAVARAGARPKSDVRSLVKPILSLLVAMALAATCSGVVGWLLAQNGGVTLREPLASKVPASRQARFVADLWAHSASYVVGILGGVFVIHRTWRARLWNDLVSKRPTKRPA